ncbi:MAG: arsenate reductase ArsC [Planctomycetales bacterium]|nr:arsenate reductase ArsC [Planctomycetales bacterium]
MRGILFLCTENAARSQMAEGLARKLVPNGVEIFSAGTRPSSVSPQAVAVMKEAGLDISQQTAKALDAVPIDRVDTVITLCGDAAAECGVWPGAQRVLHWDLPDPKEATGSEKQVLEAFRESRDEIKARIEKFLRVFAR